MFPRLKKLTDKSYAHHVDMFDTYRGQIISLWACIESAMDQANFYGWCYTRKRVAAKVPVTLNRKIKLFEEINRNLLPFEPLKEQAASLLERTKALVEDRHWMAHGYILPKECSATSWVLVKHEFPRTTGSLDTLKRTFTQDEMSELRTKLLDLMKDFTPYIEALALQVPQHPEED